MLTIERKQKTPSYVTFADIPVGTVYEDTSEYVCIKVSNTHIFWCDIHGEWHCTTENPVEAVIPLKAKLVVEGVEENKE